ncbi:MAG: class I SAM-dependent methyltransferase [Pirellulales bacterium]
MSVHAVDRADRAAEASLDFLRDILSGYRPRDFAVRLWNGELFEAESDGPIRFTLVLKHPGAVRRMFWPPNELTLAEAFLRGDFDLEGDVEAAGPLGDYLLNLPKNWVERLRLGGRLWSFPSRPHASHESRAARLNGTPHSIHRDREAIAYHYDRSNEFYALWLDRRMVYSCAYFASAGEDLDTAQERKLDYVCRKLRLRPGERFLDIGCGWGGLVIHAARNYGVHALGITLSRAQASLARERIRQAGLADRCRVELCDYRELDAPGQFDKLASIGMFEHVGEQLLPRYFAQAWELLRPKGAFLNHGISRPETEPPPRGPTFISRYVFPDGQLVPIGATLTAAEESRFEVRDVESLREHYAMTLRHWLGRLESRHDEACRAADETAYRVWRLFLALSAYGFHVGRLNLYQTLLVKTDRGHGGLPLTRADWYE